MVSTVELDVRRRTGVIGRERRPGCRQGSRAGTTGRRSDKTFDRTRELVRDEKSLFGNFGRERPSRPRFRGTIRHMWKGIRERVLDVRAWPSARFLDAAQHSGHHARRGKRRPEDRLSRPGRSCGDGTSAGAPRSCLPGSAATMLESPKSMITIRPSRRDPCCSGSTSRTHESDPVDSLEPRKKLPGIRVRRAAARPAAARRPPT